MNTQKLLLSMAIFSLSVTANAATLTLTDGNKVISKIDSSNIYEGMTVANVKSFVREVFVNKNDETTTTKLVVNTITEEVTLKKVGKTGDKIDLFACVDIPRKIGQTPYVMPVKVCKEVQIAAGQDAEINFGDILTEH
jgi:hypothetical protein